jgi:localization factor PodJL
MKSGIPWQVAGAGGETGSPGRGSHSAASGQDPLGDDGGWRPASAAPRRAAGHEDHRDDPTAVWPFGSVAPGTRVDWPEQPRPFEQVRARLLAELAKIRWTLQKAMPRSAVEALQRELGRLGERAADSRRAGVERGTVTAIERRLAEIGDALRGLKPAESLLEAANVTRLLARKIVSGATDASALEQLERAVTAMHGIVSHVASNAALAKLSEDIRALGIALDDARHRAGSRILAALEGRIAMPADQPQAVDRRDPNAPDELKVAIERLVDRIEGMQSIPGGCPAHARLEELIAKLGETLDGCDARFDRLATLESTLLELLSHIGHRRQPTVAPEPERVPPLAVATLSRDVADLRQTGMDTRDSLEIAHGTLAHVVDRLAMIETEMRGKPKQIPAPSPPTCAGAPASVPPGAPEAAPAPLEDFGTERCVADRHGTQADVLADRPQGLGPGTAHDPDAKSSGERVLLPETALTRATPPLPEDFAGTSTFIAAARRAALAASGGPPMKNGAAQREFTDHDAPTRSPGKLGVLIGGIIIIMALGALQGLGFLLPSPREAEMGAPPRTAATSTEDVAPSPVSSPTRGPMLASQSRGTFTALSPARPQDIFRYIDGANIVPPAPGSAIADWTLEQLLEAQMTPERWDDATGGIAVSVPAPFRRKLSPDFGTFHRAQ